VHLWGKALPREFVFGGALAQTEEEAREGDASSGLGERRNCEGELRINSTTEPLRQGGLNFFIFSVTEPAPSEAEGCLSGRYFSSDGY